MRLKEKNKLAQEYNTIQTMLRVFNGDLILIENLCIIHKVHPCIIELIEKKIQENTICLVKDNKNKKLERSK